MSKIEKINKKCQEKSRIEKRKVKKGRLKIQKNALTILKGHHP